MVKTTTVQKIWMGKTTTIQEFWLPYKKWEVVEFPSHFFINTILNFGQECVLQVIECFENNYLLVSAVFQVRIVFEGLFAIDDTFLRGSKGIYIRFALIYCIVAISNMHY